MGRSAACKAVALRLGELGGEGDDRLLAGGGDPVEHLAALRGAGDLLGAAVGLVLAPGDVAALHEPVDRARHGGERHGEPVGECLSVISSCSESRKSDFICVNESPTSPSTRNMSGEAVLLM